MALPEDIRYIYDSKTTSNGILWGSDLRYILSSGGKETSGKYSGINTFDRCCFIKPGGFAPMYKQCLVKESGTGKISMDGIFQTYTTNIGFFLMDNAWDNTYMNNNIGYINNARSRNVKTGVITSYNRVYNTIPTVKLAVGNFDMSHYLMIPTIRACAHMSPSTIVQADLKTYKLNYMSSHPDIIGIEYVIRYKSDLSGNGQGTNTSIKLWATQQKTSMLNWQRDTATGNQVNKFGTQYSSDRLMPISLLYYPPQLTYYKILVPFSSPALYLPSVCCPIGLSSTHGPGMQKLSLDNADPQQATRAYAYINFDTAMQVIKSVGMWFAESGADVADAHGALTTSAAVWMPIIDENGIPQDAVNGGGVTDIEDSPIYQNYDEQNEKFPVGGEDAIGAKEINPNEPPQPNTEETQTPIELDEEDEDVMPETPQLNGLGVFSNYYAMRKQGIDILNDFLWNSDESVIDDILNSLRLFGQSPIDAIVSLRLYPFDFLTLLPSTLTPEEIVLGRVETGVSGYKIPSNCSTILNLGSIYLPRKYGNFLDYAPYSSYSLYIPFCGTVNLNPNIFLDHYVSVAMVVDVTTGKCTAIVYVGTEKDFGVPIQYVDGMIGVEIPVTAENMGKLGAAVLEAVGNTAAAAVSTGVAGGAFAAVGGALDVLFSDVSPQKTGSISASGSLSMPIKMYLTVASPNIVLPDNYGHTHGYATDITTTLSAQLGYNVCYNVDVSNISGATDGERSEIKSLLEGGIFI